LTRLKEYVRLVITILIRILAYELGKLQKKRNKSKKDKKNIEKSTKIPYNLYNQ